MHGASACASACASASASSAFFTSSIAASGAEKRQRCARQHHSVAPCCGVFGDGVDDIILEEAVEFTAQKSGGAGDGLLRKRAIKQRSVAGAGRVVLRFMVRAARRSRTLWVVTAETLPPAVTGASMELAEALGHHGYTPVMTARRTIRAMQRFVGFSGLCDHGSFTATQNAAQRLLRCFDVCANSAAYSSAEISAPTARELRASAAVLRVTFEAARQRVLATQVRATAAEQQELESLVTRFNGAMKAWHMENSVAFTKRVRLVLFNLYDVEAVLRAGAAANEGCCVRKPFLAQGAEGMRKSSWDIGAKFLSRTSTFGGLDMLRKIDREYGESHGGHAWLERRLREQQEQVQEYEQRREKQELRHRHRHQRARQARRFDGGDAACAPAGSTMASVLALTRASDQYEMCEVHHESVLDPAFQIARPHLRRDDACLAEASTLRDKGREANLRLQMEAGARTAGGPSYRHLLIAVSHIRDHFEDMGVYKCKEVLFGVLDDAKWKRITDAGTMTWADASDMLHTILDFMRYCVGSEEARAVLHRDRRRAARLAAASLPGPPVTCQNAQLTMLSKTGFYRRMVRRSEKRLEVYGLERLQEHQGGSRRRSGSGSAHADSRCHALDHETFAHLNSLVEAFTAAQQRKSAPELFGEFIGLLVRLEGEMQALDVLLSNATIACFREQPTREWVLEERVFVAPWFDGGLGTANTLAWLQGAALRVGPHGAQQPEYMSNLAWDVYVAVIMDAGAAEVGEERYPELLVLDIAYLQRARGAFYGHVAQATTLVLFGQRLTEQGASPGAIERVLAGVASCGAFAELGGPETHRGDRALVESLQERIGANLHAAGQMRGEAGWCARIVREAVRETCHGSYPTSCIARSLAGKWAAVARNAFLGTPDAFASPAATQAAFSAELSLPRAARCLSQALHDQVDGIVARCTFNLAVHSRRYKALAAQL